MSQKQTPKSCSCQACKYGKHTKTGHFYMKRDERSFRHKMKIALDKGRGGYSPAPMGNLYD